MKYNLYIRTESQTYNIFGISDEQLLKLKAAYISGDKFLTLSGKKYLLSGMIEIKIFTYELSQPLAKSREYYLNNIHFRKRRKEQSGYFLPVSTLSKMGKDVTNEFIEDKEFGQNPTVTLASIDQFFVSESRIKQLVSISNKDFDLTRLIRLCEEINSNYSSKNYLSVVMIGRTIINHIPPIFGFKTFDEVSSNYGGPKEHKSFRKNMSHLSNSLKNIADSVLHQTIRSKENLPNEVQVDFKQDLDVLLGEIVRVLKF